MDATQLLINPSTLGRCWSALLGLLSLSPHSTARASTETDESHDTALAQLKHVCRLRSHRRCGVVLVYDLGCCPPWLVRALSLEDISWCWCADTGDRVRLSCRLLLLYFLKYDLVIAAGRLTAVVFFSDCHTICAVAFLFGSGFRFSCARRQKHFVVHSTWLRYWSTWQSRCVTRGFIGVGVSECFILPLPGILLVVSVFFAFFLVFTFAHLFFWQSWFFHCPLANYRYEETASLFKSFGKRPTLSWRESCFVRNWSFTVGFAELTSSCCSQSDCEQDDVKLCFLFSAVWSLRLFLVFALFVLAFVLSLIMFTHTLSVQSSLSFLILCLGMASRSDFRRSTDGKTLRHARRASPACAQAR